MCTHVQCDRYGIRTSVAGLGGGACRGIAGRIIYGRLRVKEEGKEKERGVCVRVCGLSSPTVAKLSVTHGGGALNIPVSQGVFIPEAQQRQPTSGEAVDMSW